MVPKWLRHKRENFGTKLWGQSEALSWYCFCAYCMWVTYLMTAKKRHRADISLWGEGAHISKNWLTNWETGLNYTSYISGNTWTDCYIPKDYSTFTILAIQTMLLCVAVHRRSVEVLETFKGSTGNYTKHNLSGKSNNCLGVQEVPCILWNPKYSAVCSYNCPPQVPVLTHDSSPYPGNLFI